MLDNHRTVERENGIHGQPRDVASQARRHTSVFRSVVELEVAIHICLDRYHVDPKPFVSTKSAEAILNLKTSREKQARSNQTWVISLRQNISNADAPSNRYDAFNSHAVLHRCDTHRLVTLFGVTQKHLKKIQGRHKWP